MNKILIMTMLSLQITFGSSSLISGVASPEAEKFTIENIMTQEIEETKDGWTTARVNIRTNPNTSSIVLGILDFNDRVEYIDFNDEWVKISYNKDIDAYIYKKYISDVECEYKTYTIPSNEGFKSYMGYKAITATGSTQYKIQNEYAYTGKYGIRQIGSRYCIGLGTYYGAELGQYVDLKLENGVIIKCVLSEFKADRDTDKNNIFTPNGCCSEFIVDTPQLNKKAKGAGDISVCSEFWNSPVTEIIIYDKSIFE